MIGIIGGSGLYEFPGFEAREERAIATPYGEPSDAIVIGKALGADVCFLSRHGRGHRRSPSEVPYRANIWALKSLGVDRLISVSAVGSMRRKVRPGDLVMVDQFVDWTRLRERTFFEGGIAAHVSLAEPVCERVREALVAAALAEEVRHHPRGTYVCIEGPQFSTKAESEVFRSFGVSVIGMTNMPEARLAREAEIAYATIALATDYDCWNEDAGHVSVEEVVRTLKANVEKAQRVIRRALPDIAKLEPSPYCARALDHAIMTDPARIPAALREKLQVIAGRVLPRA
jgi:5'-methylthioadenosine phosphorylase